MPKGLILYPKDKSGLGDLHWFPGMFSACPHGATRRVAHPVMPRSDYFLKASDLGGGSHGKHLPVRSSCLFLEVKVNPMMITFYLTQISTRAELG